MKQEGFPVKRFRVGEGAVSSDIRFLRKGDIFWYEKGGKPIELPDDFNTEHPGKPGKKSLFYVAVGNPVWARERTGGQKFLGLKYRDATPDEVKLIAHSITRSKRP